MPKVAIIGTTTWGITLGVVLAHKGLKIRLWARTEEEAHRLKRNGPGLPPLTAFPSQISITSSLKEALDDVAAVLLAVPSQSMRQNIRLAKDHLKQSMLVVSTAKGLEVGTSKRMSEVIAEEIDPGLWPNICVLSGPNLSKEVIQRLPASAVVAAQDMDVAIKAQKLLTAPNFTVYTNTDVVGVELGGALKNVIALGAGMVDGMGYGDNAKAAFITRGLTEMAALAVAQGASPLTLSGLAGLGDLIATCASPLSRNHHVGVELAKGHRLDKITASMSGVAEGLSTAVAVWNLAQKLGLEMPITERIYKVLCDGVKPAQAIAELLETEGRHELAGRRWKLVSLFRHRKRS
ncbi:MAG: NAD(P)-dependent glycerol-3-phosphate dehydrogenase [Chloroflexi bacterium]|nr:NAD(P)-dependent glycerol-3-phosphate dehydrogenase [Chloroflexota bacterium]